MNTDNPIKPLNYRGSSLVILDQRKLPHEEVYLECFVYEDVIKAIQDMVVRGAPAIGFAGAWACCLASKQIQEKEHLLKIFQEIEEARPTAVNLSKAIKRMTTILKMKGIGFLEEEAQKIYDEDFEMCQLMASFGLTILPNKSNYTFLTHCNTGSLATAGLGTALGVIKLIHQRGKKVHVYATETRPYLQGARLTVWELQKNDIPVTLIPDSAAAHLLKEKNIDAVFVGADRIAANGDTANKIGTYSLALAAKTHQVPFYVVAPSTSFDLLIESGEEITIEERDPLEVSQIQGVQIAPINTQCYNPSFDVTPHELISAFISEKGVTTAEKIKSLLV
jgi:methylthioribose-1-phosphate isomerase